MIHHAVLATLLAAAAAPPAAPVPPADAQRYCAGEYAEDISVLQPRAREYEERQARYTFAVRTAAVYECPFYGSDGELRRVRRRAVAHGTGFAYRQQQDGTLLVTNHHVAEWPVATDGDHPVEGVPSGCRRISVTLKIVDGEDDRYEPDDVPLARVVSDPQLDIAILKAKVALPVLPWKIGRSAALRERDVVNVRGFPLGVLQADNVGKVINPLDHDEFKDWDHDDFVIDALLSAGSSGSPVFAVSCRTGEFELVGVFHAVYAEGSALNVVVGIDQVRDLMTTLKRTPRPRPGIAGPQAGGRAVLAAAAAGVQQAVFPFGGVVAAVRGRADGALLYEVFSPDYPVESWPALVIEDLPLAQPDQFGPLGRAWVGHRAGLRALERAELDADVVAQLTRVLDALRADALTALRYRAAAAAARESKDRSREAERLEKALRRSISEHRDASQTVAELADRLGPAPGDRLVRVDEVLVAAPAAAAPAPRPSTP